jgi:ribosomal protein S18 acetylase RimI-like enzyme
MHRRPARRTEDISPDIRLLVPDSAEQWDEARALLREYAASLDVDLCFQNFEAELASLDGEYSPPGGLLLLAHVDGALAGCGAFRPLQGIDDGDACEMKRLYVRPAFRRFGLGRLLAQRLLDEARRAGYSSMLLDTLDDMEAARGLYATLGFTRTEPYYYNPIVGAHYLRTDL